MPGTITDEQRKRISQMDAQVPDDLKIKVKELARAVYGTHRADVTKRTFLVEVQTTQGHYAIDIMDQRSGGPKMHLNELKFKNNVRKSWEDVRDTLAKQTKKTTTAASNTANGNTSLLTLPKTPNLRATQTELDRGRKEEDFSIFNNVSHAPPRG
ncbi:hypothetical protein K491DRAFT_760017 [Lophiostoma macrostomum CBS 122681]|uniref:Uncharacterized protein n=1 Tax=Lophiostoma macrostomum CBS 122681 TaxID=1314788 RepID=A0A6A6SYU9_9PLEO|nr:hypothetical protein K491DRAFT_760017 [Lophiostoma macrostomum CBS 122681]